MKHLAILVPLIALTARADTLQQLSQPVIDALTTIDDSPSADVLDPVFGGSGGTAQNLQAIATATATCSGSACMPVDLGVQLHAIQSLPLYCPVGSSCGTGTVHDTLVQLVDAYALIASPSAQDLLRLRAAIEALGIAGFSAGDPNDVARLVVYLDHASRDVRATTAKALGSLCNTAAIGALRTRLQAEHLDQVKLAISAALRDLGQCPGG